MTAPYNPNAPFFELLCWHLYVNGTRPNGERNKKWTQKEFTEKPGIGERSYTNWKNGRSTRNIETIIRIILGDKPANPTYVDDLRRAVNGGATSDPIINLPFASLDDGFVGRDEFMATLHAGLSAGNPTAITGHAMHGAGGIGKTRLAVEYAWAHRADYSALIFVSASSEQNLLSGLASLTHTLNLRESKATEQDVQVNATLRWLATTPNWLLILDNVDDKAANDAVQTFLLKLKQKGDTSGRILITARWTALPSAITSHTLDVLSPDDGADLLLHVTKGKRIAAPDDEAIATAMSKDDFDGLALALEQAGAYIATHRTSLSAYRKLWIENRDVVANWFDKNSNTYLHDRNLATTFLTSYEKLSEDARLLLNLLSFLAPDPIPRMLLDHDVAGLVHPHDALAELFSNSLATAAEQSFSVHRCVQDFVQRRMSDEDKSNLHLLALVWIALAYKGDAQDVRTWPKLEPLMPHALAVSAADPTPEEAEATSFLLGKSGTILHMRARLGQAEPLKRRALAIDELSFGPNHPKVATRLNNLARLLQDTNRHSDAEPLMRRALAIDEQSFEQDHPTVAVRLNNLAQLLQDTNRFNDAEPLMRRALAIVEQKLGSDHPSIAPLLNNLSTLLQETNRLNDAEPLMRRALAIVEQKLGPDHPSVATHLNNLAHLLKASNRLAEAEPLMRRALAIDEQSFGPDHPTVATRLNNLAGLLHATNRHAEAEPPLRRQLLILLKFARNTGHEHSNLRAATNNYGAFLSEKGLSDAEIKKEFETLFAEVKRPPPTSSS